MNIGSAFTQPAGTQLNNQVIASDNAQVGQQIGAQFNDAVIHEVHYYSVSPGDPPERRHAVARAHLDAGNPRRAEEILRSLIRDGHITTERAYLYILAILSSRSYVEITADLSEEIRAATSMAAQLAKDDWWPALSTVDSLLRYAHAEYNDGSGDDEFHVASAEFGALDPARQDEIDRHLNLILSGAVHERLAAERKYQVASERMNGRRVERAGKFFEDDPLPPMKWTAAAIPATAADWRDAILGCSATALAILIALSGDGPAGALMGLAFIAAGGALALPGSIVWQTHLRHSASVWWSYQPQANRPEVKFDKLVDQHFRAGIPTDMWEATSGYRGYLKRRLQHQYAFDGGRPGGAVWLIRWHAVRAARQYVYLPPQPAEARRAANLRYAGTAVWCIGLAVWLATAHYLAFALAFGGWWAIRGVARIASVSRAARLLDHDAERLLADEWHGYNNWFRYLADRPSDAEMGRWLSMDKSYLVEQALRRANLRERDLVTHVVLAERAPYARKGRVAGGPPRYEAYQVYVFLLTRFGMRTTRTYLNLKTGDIHNEQHQMFAYDAVASASVAETGVQSFGPDGQPTISHRKGRVFQLTLVNGTRIAEVRRTPEWPAKIRQERWTIKATTRLCRPRDSTVRCGYWKPLPPRAKSGLPATTSADSAGHRTGTLSPDRMTSRATATLPRR
ncbi:hypothetical protein IU453_10320 [Nocardia cyriacigeorgica]|uniref:hypothetical protein n=1 Tax=Nocardia cyriacigeorgica TaxID=135487 RepID=UPI001894C8A4|nr:hypothetical protein [Nocardia cyriacigeorgica]MBF6317166.1 hypothetical protein [Nocardia cyriacigeorgica]MBF6532282.1 hypothetical protein [Nocardia cyriacigeorgica]